MYCRANISQRLPCALRPYPHNLVGSDMTPITQVAASTDFHLVVDVQIVECIHDL